MVCCTERACIDEGLPGVGGQRHAMPVTSGDVNWHDFVFAVSSSSNQSAHVRVLPVSLMANESESVAVSLWLSAPATARPMPSFDVSGNHGPCKYRVPTPP